MAEENKHPPTTEEQTPPEMPGKAPKMEQAEIPDVGGGPAPSAKVIDLSAVRSTPEKDISPDIPKEPEAQRVWGHPNKRFRSAEIASVNTLALLAVSCSPENGAKNGGSAVSYAPSVPRFSMIALIIPSTSRSSFLLRELS